MIRYRLSKNISIRDIGGDSAQREHLIPLQVDHPKLSI
jgi:hypothetical protein